MIWTYNALLEWGLAIINFNKRPQALVEVSWYSIKSKLVVSLFNVCFIYVHTFLIVVCLAFAVTLKWQNSPLLGWCVQKWLAQLLFHVAWSFFRLMFLIKHYATCLFDGRIDKQCSLQLLWYFFKLIANIFRVKTYCNLILMSIYRL